MVLWSKTHYVPTALVVLALCLLLSVRLGGSVLIDYWPRLSVRENRPVALTRTSEPPFSLTGLLFCLTPQQSANCVSVMFLVHWTWCDVIRALGGVGYLKTAYNWFQSSSWPSSSAIVHGCDQRHTLILSPVQSSHLSEAGSPVRQVHGFSISTAFFQMYCQLSALLGYAGMAFHCCWYWWAVCGLW